MNDDQLLRYSRQILLKQVDIAGQERLLAARALVIGLGGLGSPVAMYLAAAGVGELTLVDGDTVDLTNLQRQIAHTTERVGRLKVESAAQTLAALNPDVHVRTLPRRLEEPELTSEVARSDVVLDCSDNFPTRFLLNRLCVAHRRPLVSGAVVRFEGQVSVFRPDRAGGPCYRCLYRDIGDPGVACAEFGVLAPLPGVVGGLQATEALKVLLGAGETLAGRLLAIDALTMELRTVLLRRDPQCPVCGAA